MYLYRLCKLGLLCYCMLLQLTHNLTPKDIVNRVFTRHGPTQMSTICEVLIEYSKRKSQETLGSDKKMFETMCTQLVNAKDFIRNENSQSCIYFGWTPAKEHNIKTTTEPPVRNDNTGLEGYEHIPLYFVFVKVVSKTRQLVIEQIVYNPSIQMNIDPCLMKHHLHALAQDSNTTLDISPLKTYDNGRWYLILSNIFNLPIGNQTA